MVKFFLDLVAWTNIDLTSLKRTLCKVISQSQIEQYLHILKHSVKWK
jgi:hypothetical protein